MSKSWKQTLKLPSSTLGSRPVTKDRPRLIRACADDFYKWQASHRPADRPFVLHDGPPYANGSLHVGHALNKILKDMILRTKVQQGYRTTYRPGWDCHGLPIEIKAVGSNTKSLVPAQIRARARKLAAKTIERQMQEFRSFGVMADWENRWSTMDPQYEIQQLEVFKRMVTKGLIYRQKKPVYWSPSSRTALAEAELEYNEKHVSKAAYVAFPLHVDAAARSRLGGWMPDADVYALIWTTTPWTLPANAAVAIHDDLEYSILRHSKTGKHVIVAKSRIESVVRAIPDLVNPGEAEPGFKLRGLQYKNMLRGRDSPLQPVIHADFVSADSGTGLVHLAPGHGVDDFEACKSLGIDHIAPIDGRGHFTAEAFPDDPRRLSSGPSVLDGGSDLVLEILGEDVLHAHHYTHKYPYDWRTKQPVVLRATAQWFADVKSIKDQALSALDTVHFVPAAGKTRLTSFITERTQWCISRQRAWGVPIPALFDTNGHAVVTMESIDHIIQVIRERGISAWFSDPPDDPAWVSPTLTGTYRRGRDTMDVWFDSGTSWSQSSVPADVYLEGSDQHRGWFQSSLLTSIATGTMSTADSNNPTAPFKALVTHGFTLDHEGKKMSKSRGNYVTPAQIMDGTPISPGPATGRKQPSHSKPTNDALGPDALRLWVASSEYTRDVVIGDEVLKHVRSALVKYRVLLRMLLGSMHEPALGKPLTKMDHIALVHLGDAMREVGEAYGRFEFGKAVMAVNRWAVNDLSAFYLELLKDRLYCGDGGGVLQPILMGFLRMLAPMTPLLVEEAWESRPQWMKDDDSILHPARQLFDDPLYDPKIVTEDLSALRQDIPTLKLAHEAVKAELDKARNNKTLGSSLQSAVVITTSSESVLATLGRFADELDAMFVVSSVDVASEAPEGAESWTEFGAQDATGRVYVLPPKQHKCGRCWRYLAPREDALCGRCEDVVKGMEGFDL